MDKLSMIPSTRYIAKQYLILTLFALATALFLYGLAYLISQDGTNTETFLKLSLYSCLGLWLISLLLVAPYFRSLRYEIAHDEVIVHVGIVTKSVKHVPYRTVTNIKINRGIFDRWFFNMGTLNIQTAGMSGSTGAEESLVGLPNVHEIYGIVAERLRAFRGGMSPTTADEETPEEDHGLNEVINELKAIRKALER
ncbi:MAG: PH domain-containing protein [Candidatus Krumholzibacteria bacterium]|jgi:membrane protein YdbS with pleckstrin-like domain|nr:PH domain-containing protein [Candidatus Krumholzibacteria bacterium]MDP6670121.1 PH domain-containing protein [Candidatus Krumholzibacteria bacterium]MDP6796964.1 PH domain-containing protein [Candidatus Krumholzibacteria bacterium]MDP7021119.1 PH domain-containing protein [Candidatus Krumholzibacteria bacterium]